jgi:hypothetical protein
VLANEKENGGAAAFVKAATVEGEEEATVAAVVVANTDVAEVADADADEVDADVTATGAGPKENAAVGLGKLTPELAEDKAAAVVVVVVEKAVEAVNTGPNAKLVVVVIEGAVEVVNAAPDVNEKLNGCGAGTCRCMTFHTKKWKQTSIGSAS